MKLSEKLRCKWNLVNIALKTFPQDLMHVHVDVDCLLNQILNTLLFLCDKTLSLFLLCTNKLNVNVKILKKNENQNVWTFFWKQNWNAPSLCPHVYKSLPR